MFINTTDRSIHLGEATVIPLCCSAIGPVSPEAIVPGGRCQIPVVLKAVANEPERKRVGFVIQTGIQGLSR